MYKQPNSTINTVRKNVVDHDIISQIVCYVCVRDEYHLYLFDSWLLDFSNIGVTPTRLELRNAEWNIFYDALL